MDPAEWMARFRITHEKAKANQLDEAALRTYHAMREEFARSLVSAQSLQVPEGQNFRRHFRVAQMYKLVINDTYTAMTKEVSLSGFSTLLGSELKVGQEVTFGITLLRDKPAVTGRAKVVSAVKQGTWRVSVTIEHMSKEDAERLESALFDAALSRFK